MEATLACRDLFLRLFDEELLVLDCRSADDWARWELHVPGTLWIPLRDLDQAVAALPDDELIVVCDTALDSADAWRAIRILAMRGREAVCLEGGLMAWVSEGYPTEQHSREQHARSDHRAA